MVESQYPPQKSSFLKSQKLSSAAQSKTNASIGIVGKRGQAQGSSRRTAVSPLYGLPVSQSVDCGPNPQGPVFKSYPELPASIRILGNAFLENVIFKQENILIFAMNEDKGANVDYISAASLIPGHKGFMCFISSLSRKLNIKDGLQPTFQGIEQNKKKAKIMAASDLLCSLKCLGDKPVADGMRQVFNRYCERYHLRRSSVSGLVKVSNLENNPREAERISFEIKDFKLDHLSLAKGLLQIAEIYKEVDVPRSSVATRGHVSPSSPVRPATTPAIVQQPVDRVDEESGLEYIEKPLCVKITSKLGDWLNKNRATKEHFTLPIHTQGKYGCRIIVKALGKEYTAEGHSTSKQQANASACRKILNLVGEGGILGSPVPCGDAPKLQRTLLPPLFAVPTWRGFKSRIEEIGAFGEISKIADIIKEISNKYCNFDDFKRIVAALNNAYSIPNPSDEDLKSYEDDFVNLWCRAISVGGCHVQYFLDNLLSQSLNNSKTIDVSCDNWEKMIDISMYFTSFESSGTPSLSVLFNHISCWLKSKLRVYKSEFHDEYSMLYYVKWRILLALEHAASFAGEYELLGVRSNARPTAIATEISIPEDSNHLICVLHEDAFKGERPSVETEVVLMINTQWACFQSPEVLKMIKHLKPVVGIISKVNRTIGKPIKISVKLVGQRAQITGLFYFLSAMPVLHLSHENCLQITMFSSLFRNSHIRMLNGLKALCLSDPTMITKGYRFDPSIRAMLLKPRERVHTSSELSTLSAVAHGAVLQEGVFKIGWYENIATGRFRGCCEIPRRVLNTRPLTQTQSNVVLSSLVNRLTIIQGPPGTGKTHVSCAIIGAWCESDLLTMNYTSNRQILAMASSNSAAENIYQGLLSDGYTTNEVVRCLMRSGDPEYSMQDMLDSAKKAKVIVSTSIHIGNPMYNSFEFCRVLIDEAGQALEPSLLVGICRGALQMVIVGDHNQLPPTVKSRDAHSYGMGISLLERWFNDLNDDEKYDYAKKAGYDFKIRYVLDVQRRMHPSLVMWSSAMIYGGQVRSAPGGIETKAIHHVFLPNGNSRLVLVDTGTSCENKVGRSTVNEIEKDDVTNFVNRFIHTASIDQNSLGIITPYRAQQNLIRTDLGINGLGCVEVNSVDGFQGREKDVIVCSMVRSNHHGEIGFVTDLRRMNVMLTRAKSLLFVFMDINTFQRSRSTFWKHWIEWCSRSNCIQSDWRELFKPTNSRDFPIIDPATIEIQGDPERLLRPDEYEDLLCQ
eukprot:GHVH01012999.1.p1 GENE.GHVH01012999.1~~GHVH01012999.1.p1  ORF type:complete len:1248 (+),score=148.77 GHVH01012999.1:36-3779(+)